MTQTEQIELIEEARQAVNIAFDAVSVMERDFQLAEANRALDTVLTHLETERAKREQACDRGASDEENPDDDL